MCLWETGRLTAAELVNAGGARTVRPPANKYALIAAVAREPWRISIDMAREFRLFQRTVFRVLRNDQLHPCSNSLSTRLFPDCRAVWMDVYEWIHQQSADDRLSTKFCGQTKCFFLPDSVIATITVILGHGIILMLSASFLWIPLQPQLFCWCR